MGLNSARGFGIIADDLTGAMDTGAGFLGLGLQPFVKFGKTAPTDSSITIISTDTRNDDPQTAYRKVRRQAHSLAGLRIYKKIDSTLRGNIGVEITAVMDALKFEKAIICPAFPANGRTVVNGNLLIGNVLINETSFAKDPVYPIEDASIPNLLQKQTGLTCDIINFEQVNKGPENVRRLIRESKNNLIVIDAIEDKHLQYVAQALSIELNRWLPCGSAGLARQLPAAFGCEPVKDKPVERVTSRNPVLAVIGSRNPVSIQQSRKAESWLSIHVIRITPDKFINENGRLFGLNSLLREAEIALRNGKNVLITTSLNRYMAGMERPSAHLLGTLAAKIVKSFKPSGIFLTGGDIARETCRSLAVSGIKILKEIEPGVILGDLVTTTGDIRIITKAGGFGTENTIIDSIRYLGGIRND